MPISANTKFGASEPPTPVDRTKASLLSRVRDLNDHRAWQEFDAQYRDLILRYCRRRGLQPADAEDVRQMVMLNLAKQLRSFQYDPQMGRFRDYLGRTVRNAIHRYFRSPKPEVLGLDMNVAAETGAGETPPKDPHWETEWMDYHYRRAMDSVRKNSDAKSVAVFEELLAGNGVQETAKNFQMSPDAVHKVKQRIRDRLRRLITQQVYDEDEFDSRS